MAVPMRPPIPAGNVLLVGVSFRSAPVRILEKATIAQEDIPELSQKLLDSDSIAEAMILSTCNRMEIYTIATQFHPALDHVADLISSYTGLSVEELEPYLSVKYSDSATEHMFYMASGLDSMVVGEQQIIGQLRTAYRTASDAGTVGTAMHELIQNALHTGKRVHSETEVDSSGAGMVAFAIDQALPVFAKDGAPVQRKNALAGKSALIFGAGSMATLASTYLGKLGIDTVIVSNRTVSRAQDLADKAQQSGVNAQGVSLEQGYEHIQDSDIIVSATGAMDTVLDKDIIADNRSSKKPLVICDLSMPRDIADDVTKLDGVTLLNIEELTILSGQETRDEGAAREIVAQEFTDYISHQRMQSVIPGIKALRKYASELVDQELSNLESQTPDMSDADRTEVAKSMRQLVDKLLHSPTVEVKKLATESSALSPETALARLFALPSEPRKLNSALDTSGDLSMIEGQAS